MTTLDVVLTVAAGVVGYLLGSVNSSLVIGTFYGVDVRKHGSGNAGATNTLRTLGKKAAALATLGDLLKGFIACLIGYYMVGGELGVMAAGIAAIIGHNWPVYFKFKGGKGVLTSLAVVLSMDWRVALLVLGFFIIVTAATRYVSLGSILGAMIFPFASLLPIFHKSAVFVAFAAVLSLMVIVRHRSNIVRILNRTESKLGDKKKQLKMDQ